MRKCTAGILTVTALSLGLGSAMAAEPSFTAKLVDADKKAAKKEASVEVKAKDIKLVDPSVSGEQAKAGQGHFHYQIDDSPIIATPATKLSFHGLTPGEHLITVTLAANDHQALGAPQMLRITVPEPMRQPAEESR